MPRRRRNPDEASYGRPDASEQQLEFVELGDEAFFVCTEARQLAREHNLSPLAVNALVIQLREIRERAPAACIDEGGRVVVTSMDETAWADGNKQKKNRKSARKAMEETADALLKVEDLLAESQWRPVTDCDGNVHPRPGPDRTVCDVLCAVAREGELPDLIDAVYRLREILEEAAALDGVGGNPPVADWHREVAREVRRFWRDHRPGRRSREPDWDSETRFRSGREVQESVPVSPRARFACDVLELALGWDVSHTAHVLKRLW
jgi:hypothetical protein